MRAPLQFVVATVAFAAASVAAAQSLTPSVVFSVHDEPVDGQGDSFNGSPFEGLIRTQSSRADRAMQEFDVTGLSGQLVLSATISGQVRVNNAFDNGVRTFDFLLYAGNGAADLADYQVAAVVVGSGQYQPPVNSSFDYSFDVTAQVASLIAGGASHVGLRVEGTSNPNFPNVLSESLARLDVSTSTGTNYCGLAPANSTGASSEIRALGSIVTALNDLTVEAVSLPTNSFGYFLTSRTQGFTVNPGGSMGNLCLAGAVGRYVGPGQIQNSGSGGGFSLALDLTMTPTPGGLVAVQPGETWNFQAWHRDAVGGMATSNFTDGVAIFFM
ncbi:MAG: hypothetical protein AAF726_21255 [Planctomycetota bacterium]